MLFKQGIPSGRLTTGTALLLTGESVWNHRPHVVHLNGRQRVYLTIFLFDRLETSTSGAKVASKLSDQNPVGALYKTNDVLNANFNENINAHYKTHTFSMSLCQKNRFRLFHKCPKFFKPGSVCVHIKHALKCLE